jgi:hypothetical protein
MQPAMTSTAYLLAVQLCDRSQALQIDQIGIVPHDEVTIDVCKPAEPCQAVQLGVGNVQVTSSLQQQQQRTAARSAHQAQLCDV